MSEEKYRQTEMQYGLEAQGSTQRFFTFIYLLWMNPTDVVGEPLSAFIPISAGTEVRHNIRPGNSVPTWEGLGQHGAGKVTQSPKGNGSLS